MFGWIDWILQFFQQSLAAVTFFSIFAAGMVFTLGSLIFGGDADHGDGGGDDGGDTDHDTDHDTGHDDDQPLGILSIRGISLMATGFGGLAFIVHVYTRKVFLSSVAGIMFAWVFALGLLFVLKTFKKQQASSLLTVDQIMGAEGIVTVSIPPDQLGEVRLSVAGSELIRMATAEENRILPTGTLVRVVRYLGGTVVVSPLLPR